jgi:predicted neutral ceramidase superfamily lipid hydrolase
VSRQVRGDTAARIAAAQRAHRAPERWPWFTSETLVIVLLYLAIIGLIVASIVAQVVRAWPVSRYQVAGIVLYSVGVVAVCAIGVMALERRR